jgi:hypothetical protein
MNGPLEWFGAIGTIICAGVIATNLGRKPTGWAFVLFVLVSAAWIAAGILTGNRPIAIQNAVMFFVNAWGVWQYLLNPKKIREIEIAEQCTVEAEKKLEEEEA